MEAGKAASIAFTTHGFNNPQTKESIIKLKLYDIYVKNEKFVKNILEFNEITTFFLITLNNSKYAHNDEYTNEEIKDKNTINEEDEYTTFKNDYFKYIDYKSNVVISSLPEFIINEKTQLIFNYHENIFGLSENYYVFKYRINEFQNFLNNNHLDLNRIFT